MLNAAAGGYLFYHLAVKYDATSGFMNQQFASYSQLPSWVYSQLSQEELGQWAEPSGAFWCALYVSGGCEELIF